MRPRKPTQGARVGCERCRSAMKLTRVTPVSTQRQCYELWQCVACGHTQLRSDASGAEVGLRATVLRRQMLGRLNVVTPF